MQYYNSNQIKLIYKGYKVCKEMKHLISRKIYEIPYISYGYWNPKPLDTEDVIIPIYITDFYQCEYIYNDTSLRFKLRIEVDGIVTWKENLQAGDNTYIQFNNCTFASTPIFNGTSQDRCEFNN